MPREQRPYVADPGLAVQPAIPVEQPPFNLPPEDANYFDYANSAVLPAPGPLNRTVVVQFQVPEGKRGVIWRIANAALVGGFQDFSGAIVWRLFQNPPQAVQNYEQILYSLGALPAPSPTFIIVDENDLIQFTVETTAGFGLADITACRLAGWWFSKERG